MRVRNCCGTVNQGNSDHDVVRIEKAKNACRQHSAETGEVMYQASIENKGDSKYYARTRHSNFVLDTEGKGANPIDTLLAGLCGCMGHYVRNYLVDHQIAHHGFSIEAEAGVTPDKSRLADIHVRIDLNDVRLDDRQATGMLKFIEICKVHKILKDNPGVTVWLTGQGKWLSKSLPREREA